MPVGPALLKNKVFKGPTILAGAGRKRLIAEKTRNNSDVKEKEFFGIVQQHAIGNSRRLQESRKGGLLTHNKMLPKWRFIDS